MKPRRLLLAAGLVPVLLAASHATNHVTIGGGLNSSSTNGDASSVKYSNRLGYNFGVGFEAGMTPRFAYVFELNVETRGETAEQTNAPFDLKSTLEFTYLQIPVLAMIRIPAGNLSLNVFAGPALGIVLSAKQTTQIGDNESTADRKDDIDPFDFGIEMGAGLEAPVGRAILFIRPGYYLGLVNIDKAGSGEDEDLSLRNAKLKVGLKFPL